MDNYAFSALVPHIEVQIIQPKWWQFWKGQVTVEGDVWIRRTIWLTEEEAELVKDIDGSMQSLLLKRLLTAVWLGWWMYSWRKYLASSSTVS